jgi:hypothetical protein
VPLVGTPHPPRLLRRRYSLRKRRESARRRYSPEIMYWCWFPDPGVTRYSLDFVSLAGICPPGSGGRRGHSLAGGCDLIGAWIRGPVSGLSTTPTVRAIP